MQPGREWIGRLVSRVGLAGIAILATAQAHALVIDAGFESSITSAPNAATIETAIDTALNSIASLYSNSGTVSILFGTQSGTFLGESNSGVSIETYSTYTGQLATDSAANPANTTLATAVANLPNGNDANGSRNILATTALLRVGLGDLNITPCFNTSGLFVSGCGQTYDGVITLSSSQPLSYTRPVGSSSYDAIRIVEHEADEVLGGGGGGSTLNAIADYGINNATHPATLFNGPLDLYRYSAPLTPSFSTSTTATSYLSANGGVTDIVGFNQNSGLPLSGYGDFADFLSSTGCPDYVQDAFTCPGQTADETMSSPEYQMMEAIGYDPVPEPASLALLAMAIGGVSMARSRVTRRVAGAAPL